MAVVGGTALATVIIQGIAELEPVAQRAVVALVNHFRAEKNLAPVTVDWTAIDAKFQKDLATEQAAEKPAP